MSRKCWAFPLTPCTAGGTRATAQSATEWAVTCGTVGRPSRLGWNSTSTNASKRAQANRSPSGRQGTDPRAKPIGPGEISGLLAARVACLAAHVDLSGEGGCLMSHIQKRADRRYRARWLDPDGSE